MSLAITDDLDDSEQLLAWFDWGRAQFEVVIGVGLSAVPIPFVDLAYC